MTNPFFATSPIPPATSVNHAGGPAYELDARTALAQLAATGCFGSTYYVSAKDQLDEVLRYAAKCEPDFVAKVAMYARNRGVMKDMPAVLLAHLSTRGPVGRAALKAAFPHVINNARMLRGFVQVLRSGKVGRKSLGTLPKTLVRGWLMAATPEQLFRDSVGNKPSLVDVIKMVHPKARTPEQSAMFAYLLGKCTAEQFVLLPAEVQQYEAWKRRETDALPQVPSLMIVGRELSAEDWKAVAMRAHWHEARANLNAYKRHGLFAPPCDELVERLARLLSDPFEVRAAKALPHQLMAAWKAAIDVPLAIQNALQDAMEHAVERVPSIPGQVVVCVDTSGSMSSPVTGDRGSATTSMRCVDVAGLIAAAVSRQNQTAIILPFADRVKDFRHNPRDSVITVASALANLLNGGTRCAAPLAKLNAEATHVDAVIFVSDNESWMRPSDPMYGEWRKLKRRCPKAKMVCVNLTPNTHAQAPDNVDVLNVGGFSDVVFEVIAQFLSDAPSSWADHIERSVILR